MGEAWAAHNTQPRWPMPRARVRATSSDPQESTSPGRRRRQERIPRRDGAIAHRLVFSKTPGLDAGEPNSTRLWEEQKKTCHEQDKHQLAEHRKHRAGRRATHVARRDDVNVPPRWGVRKSREGKPSRSAVRGAISITLGFRILPDGKVILQLF